MSITLRTKLAFSTIFAVLLTLAGLSSCADIHPHLAQTPEASSSDQIKNREAKVARRFCDKAMIGKTMQDEEYADCYYFVLQKRLRAIR